MTNFEFYKDEIVDINFAVVNGTIKNGHCNTSCASCSFANYQSCADARWKWLKTEYKEPEVDWAKVKIDTPILVSDDGKEWRRSYFARFEKGKVYAWECGATSWSVFINDDVTCWNYAKLAEV